MALAMALALAMAMAMAMALAMALAMAMALANKQSRHGRGKGNEKEKFRFKFYTDSNRTHYTPKQHPADEPRFTEFLREFMERIHNKLKIYDGLHYDDMCYIIEKELRTMIANKLAE